MKRKSSFINYNEGLKLTHKYNPNQSYKVSVARFLPTYNKLFTTEFRNGRQITIVTSINYSYRVDVKLNPEDIYITINSKEDEWEICKLININNIHIIKFSSYEELVENSKMIDDLIKKREIFLLSKELKWYFHYFFETVDNELRYEVYEITNYRQSQALCYYLKHKSLEEKHIVDLLSKYNEITNQVNNCNFDMIAKTYKVSKRGYFQYRPGRDDSFNMTTERTIETDDEYIRSLFHLGIEKDSYACVGRGSEEENYEEIDFEEIKENIDIARDNYSKEKHITYYLSKYFEEVHELKKEKQILQHDIDFYCFDKAFAIYYTKRIGYGKSKDFDEVYKDYEKERLYRTDLTKI